MTWRGWLSLTVELWWIGVALYLFYVLAIYTVELVRAVAKRLRWRWIRLRLRKELHAVDLVGIARQRLP